jgi:glycine cleavage system protein P-like pyridoxal-binding family
LTSLHYNLRETFTTPTVVVRRLRCRRLYGRLARLVLPAPYAAKIGDSYDWQVPAKSIWQSQSVLGQLWHVWCGHGRTSACSVAFGLREVSETAVLNANYIQAQLRDCLPGSR